MTEPTSTADHPLLPCGVCGAMADNSTPRREYVAELLAALKEVVRISDRKHDAWDRAHAVIAKLDGYRGQ